MVTKERSIWLIARLGKVVIASSHYLREARLNLINGAPAGTKYDACPAPIHYNADSQIH